MLLLLALLGGEQDEHVGLRIATGELTLHAALVDARGAHAQRGATRRRHTPRLIVPGNDDDVLASCLLVSKWTLELERVAASHALHCAAVMCSMVVVGLINVDHGRLERRLARSVLGTAHIGAGVLGLHVTQHKAAESLGGARCRWQHAAELLPRDERHRRTHGHTLERHVGAARHSLVRRRVHDERRLGAERLVDAQQRATSALALLAAEWVARATPVGARVRLVHVGDVQVAARHECVA